jgi:oxygen-independent coproporphyrinogen-3 oxidase
MGSLRLPLGRLWAQLRPVRRRQLLLASLLMLVSGALEMVSVAAVLPLLVGLMQWGQGPRPWVVLLFAVAVAASIFERFSFDLIYARPGQTPSAWKAELQAAIAHAAEHLSLYQLTIEPDTMYERLFKAGKLAMPDADTARALWDVTQETTSALGLPAYEISNHARPGAESRHNLIYWRYGEYAGIGPGAHGRIQTPKGRLAQATEKHPEMWLTSVETDGHGVIDTETLSAEAQGDEFLLMGLRLTEGIDPDRFEALSGRKLASSRIADLVGHGMVEMTRDGRLRVTSEGFPVLDAVVADLAS